MFKYGVLALAVVVSIGVVVMAVIGPVSGRGRSSADPAVAKAGAISSSSEVVVDPPGDSPPAMKWIPGGAFRMGNSNGPHEDERHEHKVAIDGFWMDETEVTNAQFAKFVSETKYVTIAERKPKREDIEAQVPVGTVIDDAMLVPGSICFNPQFDMRTLRKDFANWPYQVWKYEPGADWRHPLGAQSSIEGREDHPVIHVSWDDACPRKPNGSGRLVAALNGRSIRGARTAIPMGSGRTTSGRERSPKSTPCRMASRELRP